MVMKVHAYCIYNIENVLKVKKTDFQYLTTYG